MPPSPLAWPLARLGLSGADDEPRGRGVTVAVLDAGINLEHPDFSRRRESVVGARSFVPGEPVGEDPGHGTHCAGIVAGPELSSSGWRYGVAPGARLLVGKVLDGRRLRGRTSAVLEAIRWARDRGARIILLSFGAPRSPGASWSPRYEALAGRLLGERPGTLLIAAAGNNSERPRLVLPLDNPAACPSVVSVGATDRAGGVARFSHGPSDGVGSLDVCAPGVSILSAWAGSGFSLRSGTSPAAPFVAGVAALWLEREPWLSARELRDRLINAADPALSGPGCGAGLVQAPPCTGQMAAAAGAGS